jgi:hypothetical protein
MRTLLLAAALAAVAAPACAQAVCGARAEIAARLAGAFAEAPVGRGLSSDGFMVEVFAGPEGTWTLVVTRPDGRACLAAAGEAWTTVAPQPAGRDS